MELKKWILSEGCEFLNNLPLSENGSHSWLVKI